MINGNLEEPHYFPGWRNCI